MTSFYDSYDYYKRMLELQEKLRKSEEERIRLEERFKILAQESRNRHDACINRLRLRYIEFLEEQRVRDERSHKLIEALERVDNSLALMTTKTDRLNVLRKQYEAYLRRMYKVPDPSESTIDDSNYMKQRDDAYLRRDATVERIDLSSDRKCTSPLEMFPRNGAVNRSISPSASKWMKSPQSTYYDNCQRSVAQPISLNQQMNDSQNILRIYSTIPESVNAQLSTQSPSLQTFQQKQSHDENLYVSQLPFSGPSTLIQQTVPYSNRPPLERAETVSQIGIPERTNGSISRYKFIDAPPNRFTPIALQHYVRPSPTVQCFRQESDKVLLGDTSKQTRISSQIPQVYTMPVTPERSNIRGTSFLNKSFNLPRKTVPCYTSPSPRKSDYLRKSMTESPARLLTTSAVDDIIKRHNRFSPKSSGSPRLSMETRGANIGDDERRTAIVVENELDRYIDKIKKLHRDLDAQSLEEVDQKQNTRDNMLNASPLDDNIEFSNGGQSKGNLPKEVEKVLALANDLASRTADFNVANDTGKGCTDKNRKLGLVEVTRNDATILERSNVMLSDMDEGRETSKPHAKDRISNDIKLPKPKLDSYENIDKPWEQNLSGLDNVLEQHEQESSKTLEDADFVASSDDIVAERKNTEDIVVEDVERKDDGIYIAQESSLQQYSFDVAEELEPWDLDILQKRIKELDLIGDSESRNGGKEIVTDATKLNQDNTEHVEFSSEMDNLKNQEVEQDSKEDMNINETDSDSVKDRFKQGTTEHFEQEEASTDKNAEETSETSALGHPTMEYENDRDTSNVNDVQNANLEEQPVSEKNEFGNEQREECNENNSIADVNQDNEQQVATQGEEYSNQNYYDDSNRAENYTGNYETGYTGVNEEYNYEQNTPYEGNQEQNYDPNVSYEADQQQHYEGNAGYENNQDQSYDQNVAYDANETHGYEEYINQEYVPESNEQYGEYVGEQYDSENQYERDPNAQYQEDTNQQYAYPYDQQYESNQEGNAAPNQPTEYTEPNQSDLKQEDRPNDEQKEFQEGSVHQEEAKVNTEKMKNETLLPENEPKKKKDVIKSLLDSDTDSTIERNASNTESDFDFN